MCMCLSRYPAMRVGLDPVREILLTHGVEVEVQSIAVHERVMKDGFYVTLQLFDRHVVQVTG